MDMGKNAAEVPGEANLASREVVAIFDSAQALDDAIEMLEVSGTDRAAISVMAGDATISDKMAHRYQPAAAMSDADNVTEGVKVTRFELAEGMGAAVSVPVYIGVIAGLMAVFSIGGGILAATLAGLAGGAVGGGFGGVAAHALGKHHAEHLDEQLQQGGLLLWVHVVDDADEQAKIDLLRSSGGRNVHGHLYHRQWGVNEVPLHDAQPDPFLTKD